MATVYLFKETFTCPKEIIKHKKQTLCRNHICFLCSKKTNIFLKPLINFTVTSYSAINKELSSSIKYSFQVLKKSKSWTKKKLPSTPKKFAENMKYLITMTSLLKRKAMDNGDCVVPKKKVG